MYPPTQILPLPFRKPFHRKRWGGCVAKHLHQCSPRQQWSWALGNKTPLPSSCHTCPGLFTPAATYSPETKMPPCLETDEDPLRSLDMIRIWIYQKHCLLWDAEIARCISIRGIGASSESITCILKSDGYLMLPQWIWSSPKRSALWNRTSPFYDGWFSNFSHYRHVQINRSKNLIGLQQKCKVPAKRLASGWPLVPEAQV